MPYEAKQVRISRRVVEHPRRSAMAENFERQCERPKLHGLTFDDRLALLVEAECVERDTRKLKRLLRVAGRRSFSLSTVPDQLFTTGRNGCAAASEIRSSRADEAGMPSP